MSEKKRISKKLIAAIAVVLVIAICIVSVGALAVCGAIVGAVVMNQPKVVAANALTGAASAPLIFIGAAERK